jgi:hypothetical protein
MTLDSLAQLGAAWRERAPQTGPEAAERESARRALANICHAVMNSAEFLFVD